jgi:hypothetical protein
MRSVKLCSDPIDILFDCTASMSVIGVTRCKGVGLVSLFLVSLNPGFVCRGQEPVEIPVTRNSAFIAIFLCAAAIAAGAQDQKIEKHQTEKFSAGALFQPGMSEMQAARDTCSKVPGPQFGACFVQQMQAAGASPEAVAFMRAVDNDGFMRDFRKTGRVDIAFAFYPFAANENQHCLLVNGTPNLIDVDDYKLLPKDALARNPAYSALRRKFPNLAVFPGDRSGTKFVTAENLPDGGQRFVVPYTLVDGCHACARTGALRLAFNFDRSGKFLGTKVADVTSLVGATQSAN